jgi:hypothetical protein
LRWRRIFCDGVASRRFSKGPEGGIITAGREKPETHHEHASIIFPTRSGSGLLCAEFSPEARWGFFPVKRFTETEKWRDSWFQQLRPEHKLALIYIYDNCDNAGVFDPNLALADFCIGQCIDWQGFRAALGDRLVVLDGGKWYLPKFVQFQYGTLSPDCKPHAAVLRLMDFHRVPKGYPKGIHTHKDKDKEKEKDKDTDKDKETDAENPLEKSACQIRAEALFRKRISTPMDAAERRAWQHARAVVEATTPDEWAALEAFYAADESTERKLYRRKNLATLLNNWSGEIAKARAWQDSQSRTAANW